MSTSGHKFRKQYGIALIELIISLVIGTLLLGIVVQIYLDAKEAERLQIAINDIEFNAKQTISILSNEIKRAGHIGCAKLTAEFPLEQNNLIDLNHKIEGTQHEIAVRYVELPASVVWNMSANVVLASLDKQFNEKDVLMISDCHKAEIFQVAHVLVNQTEHSQTITPMQTLKNQFGINAEIGKVVNNRYFIRDVEQKKALYVENIDHRKIALVDDINDLDFAYTVKEGNQSRDVSASEVMDWSNVVGISADIRVSNQKPTIEKIWHMYVALSP